MLRKNLSVLIVFIVLVSCASDKSQGINALALVPSNTGANYYLMSDVIEEYGWNVTHTGVFDTIAPCPWFASHGTVYPIIRDKRLEDIADISDFDCLIIPPSAGNAAPIPNSNADIIQSEDALMLIRRAVYYGLPVFSTCAGVRVLAAADVLSGKFIVGSPRFRDEYTAAGANYIGRPRNDNPPTIDGNIITSARGQYYNYANVMAIATLIEGNQPRGKKGNMSSGYLQVREIKNMEEESIAWAKTYGGAGADGGRAFCLDNDGGYVIVGYTFAPGSNDADILVFKTDVSGDVIWSKRMGGAGTEYGNACLVVENGYLVLGYTTSFGAGSKDIYLLRLNNDGEEVWSKTYGGISWDVGTALCEVGENEYFLCGFTHSFGWGEEDIYLIKIDQHGNEVWSKTYGGFRIDMANSIHATGDGGCVIGTSSGSHSANTDFSLIKIDAQGERQWVQYYSAVGTHGHGFDWCKSSSATDDGGFVITGYSDCNDMMDAVVIKTDADGNEQWLTSFGNKPFYDYGNAVLQADDGTYVVASITKSMKQPTTESKATYKNQICLTELDAGGSVTGEKTIIHPGSDWANALAAGYDGAYTILGHTNAGMLGSLDVLFIRIESF